MGYLCIDFGGTKTLVCILDEHGSITTEVRFETPEHYPDFLDRLTNEINSLDESFTTGVMSVPGLIDQSNGTVLALGNRLWTHFTLQSDVRDKTGVTLTLLNDARLGGLAEGRRIKDQFYRVLYITVSTGIGGALVLDGKLDRALDNTEFGKMPLYYEGNLLPWEEFASGRAIVAQHNMRASDITDDNIWRSVAHNIVLGLAPVCAVLQPEAIVFGGGVGQQSDKYSHFIADELSTLLHPVIRQPRALLQSFYQDEAVIYGCYALARDME